MKRIKHIYYVTMIDYGSRGREAVVDPDITGDGVINRIASGEYKNIVFIHLIKGSHVDDVTDEMIDAADDLQRKRVA